MICGNCHRASNYVKLYSNGEERCHNCGNFSEASGAKTDGILTRQRNSQQAWKHEGDTLLPHKYDKTSKQLIPNPEFVKQFPDRVSDYFDESEITKAGMPKLAKRGEANKRAAQAHKDRVAKSVEFVGSTKSGMEKLGVNKK